VPGPSQTIAERLTGKTLLITGASGFLGKAVLATCLRELPELGAIRLLLRAPSDEAATERLRHQVLGARAFDGGRSVETELTLETGRLSAFAGDVTAPGLGREAPLDLSDVDAVIHCAASVSFEQPLDEMLELNVLGTLAIVEALRRSGSEPNFVHVSTAYAAGMRTGLVLERPSGQAPAEPAVDMGAELDVARAWRRDIEIESRLPEHQHRFVAEAREEVGPAGAPAIGARAEQARRRWVGTQLSERGRERSRALGWSDAYGLSKALTERALLAQGMSSLTIVRPTIIESALRDPFPGWIEGVKVADPIILAYGRGIITRFPSNRSVRLDLVPVDIVANACIAAAAHPPEGGPRTMNVASGARNPLLLEDAAEEIVSYFRERPLPDDDGYPVEVPDWKYSTSTRVFKALDRGDQAIRIGRRLAARIPLLGGEAVERRLHQERRALERLRRLAQIYGPYVELDCMFDDRYTRELLDSLHPDDAERFSFDVERIDWPSYLTEIHLPALREVIRPWQASSAPRVARDELGAIAEGPPALAFFDVEGVVLDTTVAHFYAWLRTREMPVPDRLLWTLGLAARAPGYIASDRRSRVDFNRRFYRNYRDLPAAELREQAAGVLSEFILPHVQQEAVRRIRRHRRRGDRVVLLTGALDFLVKPLEHLADELIAARLIERRGAFTGELAEPPLSADGRASLTARLAVEHGVELADCHAYGDSVSDLPMLEAVGHPYAVNPDFRLAREARRRGWALLEWKTEAGARSAPPAAIEA